MHRIQFVSSSSPNKLSEDYLTIHMIMKWIPNVFFLHIFTNAKVESNGRRQYPIIRTRTSCVYYAREPLLLREDVLRGCTSAFMVDRFVCFFTRTAHDLPARYGLLLSRDIFFDFDQEQEMILQFGLRAASMRQDMIEELYAPYYRIFWTLSRHGTIETSRKKNTVKHGPPTFQMRSSWRYS